MAHHTHFNEQDGWYSFCDHCDEKYGESFGHCRCGDDPYAALDNPDMGPQWKFEKGNEPDYDREWNEYERKWYESLDPFDVEPSSDPPDEDLMVDLHREELREREAYDYDELNRRLDP